MLFQGMVMFMWVSGGLRKVLASVRTVRELQVQRPSICMSSALLDSDTPAGDHDSEKTECEGNAGRLDAFDREVCFNAASKLPVDLLQRFPNGRFRL